MPNSSQNPWSSNPNAPQITYSEYFSEKAQFAGLLIGGIFYGLVIVLFLQCMNVLLNPVDRTRGGIKWGLMAHTAAMFLFVTIYTTMNLDIVSVSCIDYREFPGDNTPPGPFGYMIFHFFVLNNVPTIMFFLNNWLADGLLLYRCYVIYAKNRWAIALPCLMYLASMGMGIIFTYQSISIQRHYKSTTLLNDAGLSYFSISVSLNILLTLMIIARLVLHNKDIRNATGGTYGSSRLYKAVAAVLIESYALYAISFLTYVVLTVEHEAAQLAFFSILAEAQVLAPYFVILRVANRTAVTSDDIVSESIGSIRFRSRESSTGGDGTPPDEDSMSPADERAESNNELGIRGEDVIEEVPL